jgi:hypothetical protein
MQAFNEFAWFFEHSYYLGQLRRVRIESATLKPWFSFFASLATEGGSCELAPAEGGEWRSVAPHQLMAMTDLPDDTVLSCGGYCGTFGFSSAIFPGECGEVAFDSRDVCEATWHAFLDLLQWIARETKHDVLIVSEYQSHDGEAPLEDTWLRFSRDSRDLCVEGDQNRNFE